MVVFPHPNATSESDLEYFPAFGSVEILVCNPVGPAGYQEFLSALLLEGSTCQVPRIVGWRSPPTIQSLMLPETVQTRRLGFCCCLLCKFECRMWQAGPLRAGQAVSSFPELWFLGEARPLWKNGCFGLGWYD